MFLSAGRNRKAAYAMVTLGAILISFSAVFVNMAHVGPSVSAFYRVFFGGIILAVISLVRGDSFWAGKKAFKLVLLAGITFTLDLFFWHRSIIYVGPGLATILGNFQVFFVAGFAIFFLGEKPTLKLLLAIPMAVAGLFMIIGFDWAEAGSNYHIGVFLGLFTAISYTVYLLILRYSQRITTRLSIYSNLAIISLISAAFLGLEIFLRGQESFAIPDLQTWGALLGLGIVSQVLGWILISYGLPKMDASIAGLLLLLQPALAFTWDILFFGRSASAIIISGAILTIVAIYLGSTGRRKKAVQEETMQEKI
jgi:drug/metabolite transporter (DMT)-like permease